MAALTRDAATPTIPPREPPIRYRKNVPTCWISLELVEGKNRQVRRMTAAIGHPTLRLIRVRIGQFWLNNLPVSKWRVLSAEEFHNVSKPCKLQPKPNPQRNRYQTNR